MPQIKGISKTSLWNAWKTIRRELRNSSVRDVIDYVDFDVEPEVWIRRLLRQIASGQYEPTTPFRFTLGKSNGLSRTMTQPAIPDLVLYRAIVDAIYVKAMRREHAHVYFKRERLRRAQRAAERGAAQAVDLASQYKMSSRRSFYNWLKFAQYRKHLLLERVHPYFVITDVTNFFDSVLHSHVDEALRGLPVAPRMVGLLFLLLERLSLRHDYASSPAISLPVDEFDCSRTLAHISLFGHDDEMTALVGEQSYVRWMDDQNFGVGSVGEGLRVLSGVGRSLARLHLTPNGKKSQILTLAAARRHFHLDLNQLLDDAEAALGAADTRGRRRALSGQIRRIWFRARPLDGKGEFDKVLKRLYRLAGTAGLRFLRVRATRDVLSHPPLARRVCDYMRCSGTAAEYVTWARALMDHPEQIYPDVNICLAEGLLRLEADRTEAASVRALASSFLSGSGSLPGGPGFKALAPLLVLRFGDRRSLRSLGRCFANGGPLASSHLLRAASIVYASYGSAEFATVRRAASRLLRNHLAEVVRLVERIRAYRDVPVRYRARLALRYDAVSGTKFVDMRALLTARLLRLSRARGVAVWLDDWKGRVLLEPISDYDRRLVRRLL